MESGVQFFQTDEEFKTLLKNLYWDEEKRADLAECSRQYFESYLKWVNIANDFLLINDPSVD